MTCRHDPFLDEDTGEIVCKIYAQVIEEGIESTNDRETFDDNLKPNTTRGPPNTSTIDDNSLSTVINKKNVDCNNNPLPFKTSQQMYKLKKLDTQSKYKSQEGNRGIKFGLMFLSRIKSKINMPNNIYEIAAKDFRALMQVQNFAKGRSIEQVVSASLYLTFRNLGSPKTLEEICKITNIRKKALTSTIRYVIKETGYQTKAPGAEDFITKACNILGTTEKTKRDSLEFLRIMNGRIEISGKKPSSLAAAVIYKIAQVNGEIFSQTTIADELGVTAVSIRNMTKLKFWDEVIPKITK